MAEQAPIPDKAYAEAAAWLARLCADRRDAVDEEGFRAWLAAAPENAVAFEAIDRTWDVLGAISVPDETVQERREPRISRRLLLAGVGLVTVGATSFYA
ncbi:MAG TPA: DUF4880 domain-containing protein, partial [Verrucomicrobiae bacterium]|nr:DUF4880 domain-containing protein [Verrucomicrobiae bacterium]